MRGPVHGSGRAVLQGTRRSFGVRHLHRVACGVQPLRLPALNKESIGRSRCCSALLETGEEDGRVQMSNKVSCSLRGQERSCSQRHACKIALSEG